MYLFNNIKNKKFISEKIEILKPIEKEKEKLIKFSDDKEADDVVINLSLCKTNPNSLNTPLKT